MPDSHEAELNVSSETFDGAAAWASFSGEDRDRLGELFMCLLAARYARGWSDATDLAAGEAEARTMRRIEGILSDDFDYARVDDRERFLMPA